MGFFGKLKESLSKTKESINEKFDSVIKVFKKVDDELFDELEEVLITSDLGVNTSCEIIERLRGAAKEKHITESHELKAELAKEESYSEQIEKYSAAVEKLDKKLEVNKK